MKIDNSDRLLSTQETMALLGIGRDSLLKMVKEGQLSQVKLRLKAHPKYRLSEVQAILTDRTAWGLDIHNASAAGAYGTRVRRFHLERIQGILQDKDLSNEEVNEALTTLTTILLAINDQPQQ